MDGGDATKTVKDDSGNIAGGGETVTINIRCVNESKLSVQVSLNSTVGSFKSILSQSADIPAEQQRVIYNGQILKDDQTLKSYGLEADHTVHLVRGFAAAASASATNVVNPNANQDAPRVAVPTTRGLFVRAGGAPLFSGLGSRGGLFGAGLPDFEQVQQQLTQNSNMMREMMNMPLVQNLMNNPEIICNLIMNNPQMREFMNPNPELAYIFNDPAILEAARNPELMHEMINNIDWALSSIESPPDEFNMHMYENIQEPFLIATTMAGDTRNDSGTNSSVALWGAQEQGRNQSTNPPATGSDTTANPPAPNSNPLSNSWAAADIGGAQMNTTPRSNAARNIWEPPLGGLDDLPDLQRMLGGMPDASSENQLMEYPAISQIMQHMNEIMGLDPNSHPRDMMPNPEFIRQLTSSERMQEYLVQQGLFPHLDRPQSNQEQEPEAVRTEYRNQAMEVVRNVVDSTLEREGLRELGRFNVGPEELYAIQLIQFITRHGLL
ncbi:ubiquitin domain-containing protein DSK2b-like isoform X1 [Solanum tuberosum]|uniref:ubiquitin domain-containing protein DSK2b-like isoform X1 n=1 Tax=Solanum tuberosum TaxID=4113 RepID=UPI00073A3B60|nr:PREDICTED: ubiquitin domain-containing protein DSK2b-like isoform X1 [Solanum tuberosum]